jgi:hypothetical protein
MPPAADSAGELRVSAAEDMPDGADRECVQAAGERPDDEFPDDWGGDAAAGGRGGTPGDEGAQVGGSRSASCLR